MMHPERITNVCTGEVIQLVGEYLKCVYIVLAIMLVKEILRLLSYEIISPHLLAGRERNLSPFSVKMLRLEIRFRSWQQIISFQSSVSPPFFL